MCVGICGKTKALQNILQRARCDAPGFPPNARPSYEHDNVRDTSRRRPSGCCPELWSWHLIINLGLGGMRKSGDEKLGRTRMEATENCNVKVLLKLQELN